jgi:uncharacterized protein involved in tellurium resistance
MTFADGIKGKAAKFDGRSGINVKDDNSLDLSTAFSFSMWLYKDDQGAGGWAPILSKGDTAEYGPYALLHDSSGVSPGVRLTGGSTTSPDHLFTTVKTNLKEWYLFTTTWDGSNIKFYVNDILVDTKPWNDVFKNDSSQLLIGYDPPGVTEYFRGLMDDFRAYNYSLSPAEITDLYNHRLPEDKEPPVTTAKITPEDPNGTNGWYTKDASITLTAADKDSGVEKTEYRINNGEWKVYTGAIPVTENGPYTVEFHSIDKSGNIEEIKSISFKLDTTKPFTMANVVPGEPDGTNNWYKSTVSITLSPSDEGSGIEKIEYQVGEGNWLIYDGPISVKTGGNYTIAYHSIDKAGNVEDSKSISLKLDNTKPVTKAESAPEEPDGTNEWYKSEVNITLSASDEGSGVEKTEYRLNEGDWKTYESPILIKTDGISTIDYRSSDRAGNVEDSKSISLKLDNTKPVTKADVVPGEPNGTNDWYATDTTITLSASDEGSGIEKTEYRVNEGDWKTYESPILIKADGIYTIDYRSSDRAGNVEDSKSISLKSDNTKPVTKADVVPGNPDGTNEWYKSEVSITLSASDEGSGIEKTEYRINEGDWKTYESPIQVKTDGIYKIEYRSIDKAGNIEESKSALIKLDKTNPVTTSRITQGEPNGANGWYTTDVIVELAANDGQSGISIIEYRVDGSEWAPYKAPIQLTTEGIHRVEYRSKDNAGNTEELKSINVKIDKTLPDVKLNLSRSTIWPPNHKMVVVTVKPEITDSISGFQSIVLTSITSSEPDEGLGDGSTELDIQNAEFGTADFKFDLRAERSGINQERIYTITYTITDQAGNVRKVKTTIAVRHD